jgi:anti-sigma regulatory factor (Ser/Thr protein kinase)
LLKEIKERYPQIRRILITAYNVEDYLDLALQYDVGNIFVKTTPFNFHELSVTIEKLLHNNIFGLHHYFSSDATFAYYSIKSSQQLDKDAGSIVHFIDHKSEIHRLELVVVELLTNALFYGMRNEPPDQKEDWDHNFELPDDEAVKVAVGKDTEKYGISISDTGGRLKKHDVLFWLHRQTTRDPDGLPVGLYDTHGRGLFIARKYIDRLIINIDQTRKTEIVVLNYYTNTYKGFKPLYIYEL